MLLQLEPVTVGKDGVGGLLQGPLLVSFDESFAVHVVFLDPFDEDLGLIGEEVFGSKPFGNLIDRPFR